MMGARTGYQTPSKRPPSRELALQRHLGAGGELPLEGDPRRQKSQNINHWLSVCSRFIFSIFLTW